MKHACTTFVLWLYYTVLLVIVVCGLPLIIAWHLATDDDRPDCF